MNQEDIIRMARKEERMNIIKQPMPFNTIRFFHPTNDDRAEVMSITRDGVWVNPDMSVDDAAQAVLRALDSQIKVLVGAAVAAEREACAKVCEEIEMQGHALWDRTADPDAQGRATGAMDCAAAIRARSNT